jgi:uncharacterized membrane protein YuzA (DUF378 family)
MKSLHLGALALTTIGALNWGLWGLFQFDLVAALCGGQTAPLSRVVYSLVGLAGVIVAGTSMAMYGNARTTPYLATNRPLSSSR